ncbi:ArdC-like ssDNA-binding domain-containing protein [Poseidonibacter ostreae]|uniref:DUF1738 domain-containing protein n=1 Tax=Poseidonibacter ostreae TaxID=2654171 RepID=A0A6L4WU22_9BACT|nr:ArdC-like ssDNA-binding domain-containing protein [Poseidonibacter ostreae]KAB7889576.1 DUF1738 domain-containing protein [Poseidonibacter ostreae]
MKTTTVEKLFVETVESAMSAIKFPKTKSQINGSTGRSYTKVNQLLLISSQTINKYESNEWLSKEQAESLNLSIMKDTKGTMLFSTNIKEDANNTYVDKESGEVKPFKVKTYNYYYVFNLDQLEQKKQKENKA